LRGIAPGYTTAVQIPPFTPKYGTTIINGSPLATGQVGVDLKKLLTLAGVALALFFLITQPAAASNLVTTILNMLKNAAEALVTFVQTLI